jgi:DNA-binding transcriptional regulator/RsmH inhibitor MraZ
MGKLFCQKVFEKCVYIYDKMDWSTRVEEQIADMSYTGLMKKSDLQRYIYTSAVEADVDSQGRIVFATALKGLCRD